MAVDSTTDTTESDYSLLDKTKSLINNKDLSDVCFLVGESTKDRKKIYGHKVILSMGSPVFKETFFGNQDEKTNLIEITDLTTAGFMNMIRYIYGEKISFALHESYETYVAGKNYMVENLCNSIRNYLKDNLNEENRALVYDQLVKIKVIDSSIDNSFIDDVRDSIDKLTLTNSCFNKISKDTLIDLLSMPHLELDEFDILKSCLNWINATNSPIENKRSSFQLIKPFIEINQTNSFLTKEKISDLLSYLTELKNVPYQPLSVSFKFSNVMQFHNQSVVLFHIPLQVNHDISLKSIATLLPSSLKDLEFEFCLEEKVLVSKFFKTFENDKITLVFTDNLKVSKDVKYKLKFFFTSISLSKVRLSVQEKSKLDNGVNKFVFKLDSNHCIEKFIFFSENK